MDYVILEHIMRSACDAAVRVATAQSVPLAKFQGRSRRRDHEINKLFDGIRYVTQAETILAKSDVFVACYGAPQAKSFVLRFMGTYLGGLQELAFDEATFEKVWIAFRKELEEPHWTYFAVCNLKNFRGGANLFNLGNGITIRLRNLQELATLLEWSEETAEETLVKDWNEGGFGEYVMLVESRLDKTPENLALLNDIATITKLQRVLLALRLYKEGNIRVGKIFYARPSHFYRFDFGGSVSSGYSTWDPGEEYVLDAADVPAVQRIGDLLTQIEGLAAKKPMRALLLAFRSFTSIYERQFHQAEDQLVDAITAIEAVLQIDSELRFRNAFRVAGILGANDNERVVIFDTVRRFYDTRSKVVHGGDLGDEQIKDIQNHQVLLNYVRRLLVGFLQLAANGKMTKLFYEELDAVLQHEERRRQLRLSMGMAV